MGSRKDPGGVGAGNGPRPVLGEAAVDQPKQTDKGRVGELMGGGVGARGAKMGVWHQGTCIYYDNTTVL